MRVAVVSLRTSAAARTVPGQLPNVAMGWVLLFHMERAAALLGVIGLVLLIGWRAVQGELPIKLGNLEYEVGIKLFRPPEQPRGPRRTRRSECR